VHGSEIHIEIYDDQLKNQLPGRTFESKPIPDCDINTVGFVRYNNPMIADLLPLYEIHGTPRQWLVLNLLR